MEITPRYCQEENQVYLFLGQQGSQWGIQWEQELTASPWVSHPGAQLCQSQERAHGNVNLGLPQGCLWAEAVLPRWAGPGMFGGPRTGVQETWVLVQPESLTSSKTSGQCLPWIQGTEWENKTNGCLKSEVELSLAISSGRSRHQMTAQSTQARSLPDLGSLAEDRAVPRQWGPMVDTVGWESLRGLVVGLDRTLCKGFFDTLRKGRRQDVNPGLSHPKVSTLLS